MPDFSTPAPIPPRPPMPSGSPPPPPPVSPPPATPPSFSSIPQAPRPSGPSRIDVRTMASDVRSIGETGGGPPRPYTPTSPPPPSFRVTPSSPPPSIPTKPSPFPTRTTPSFSPIPSATPPLSSTPTALRPKEKKSKKHLVLIIVGILVVGATGALGYFFVFPMLFSKDGKQPPTFPAVPPPLIVAPVAPLPELVPQASPSTSSFPSGVITPPPTPPPLTGESPLHSSLFAKPADRVLTLPLPGFTAANVRSSIPFTTSQTSSFVEYVFTPPSDDSAFLTLSALGELSPQVFTDEFVSLFENDFTFAVYTDAKGAWPVYLLKMKLSVNTESARTEAKSRIEGAAILELNNLFLTEAGGAGEWKDGQAEGIAGRYLAFNRDGAALNYGWKGNVLVIGTSYAAYKEALKRL